MIIPCQLSFKLIIYRTLAHHRSYSPHYLIFLISRPRRTKISKNIHANKVTGKSVTSGIIIVCKIGFEGAEITVEMANPSVSPLLFYSLKTRN